MRGGEAEETAMRKKLIVCLLLAAMLLGLSACSIYDKTYTSEEDYQERENTDQEAKNSVRNYFSLRQSILKMVKEGQTEGTITFVDYDGDISTDLKSACWLLQTRDALCQYCVKGITYNLSQVISYEEATIHISYSKTQEQIASVIGIDYSTSIGDCVVDAMKNQTANLVLLVNNSNLSQEEVQELVQTEYLENPLLIPSAPSSTVTVYAGTEQQRLYEISLNYGASADQIESYQQQATQAIENLSQDLAGDTEMQTLKNLCSAVVQRCSYDSDTPAGNILTVLSLGRSDSQGFAMTAKALCTQLGISCSIVRGSINGRTAYWNIATLSDGHSYQMDLSQSSRQGLENFFLRSDEDLWAMSYRWVTEDYPSCNETLNYSEA